jgi:Cu/Zn superoxide dismutase
MSAITSGIFQLFKSFFSEVEDASILRPLSNAFKHHTNIEIQTSQTNGEVHLVQTNFQMPSTLSLNNAPPATMAQHIASTNHV